MGWLCENWKQVMQLHSGSAAEVHIDVGVLYYETSDSGRKSFVIDITCDKGCWKVEKDKKEY